MLRLIGCSDVGQIDKASLEVRLKNYFHLVVMLLETVQGRIVFLFIIFVKDMFA